MPQRGTELTSRYRALSSIGWAELSVRDKLLLFLLWPVALLRAISVPSAGPEGQWSRILATLSPITVPLLALFATKGITRTLAALGFYLKPVLLAPSCEAPKSALSTPFARR